MSLKKIAELAGTSVSTVSRVLNTPGHTCHIPGLSEKIWQIAKELEYIPNEAARNLRTGNNKTKEPFYTDIFLTRFDSLDKDPFFGELFIHIKEELLFANALLGEVLNFTDIMSLGEKDVPIKAIPYKTPSRVIAEKPAALPAFVSKKHNTGLILLGKCPQGLIPVLKKRYSYITGIDRNPTDYEYDEVICNGITAAQKAVGYLIKLGHNNIAYIGDCTFESRYTGYYQALLAHKIPLNYANVHQTGQTEKEGFQVMSKIIKSDERPSAIFCANDITAIGVLNALKANKRKGYVPSVISIDNIYPSQKTTPMLTTIDIPKKEMAHLAVMLLLDRKAGRHRENIRIELPCRLIERESCIYKA
ncbi:MAG: LacI family transcriptional regulator [Lachnospiraceae bacterium]